MILTKINLYKISDQFYRNKNVKWYSTSWHFENYVNSANLGNFLTYFHYALFYEKLGNSNSFSFLLRFQIHLVRSLSGQNNSHIPQSAKVINFINFKDLSASVYLIFELSVRREYI